MITEQAVSVLEDGTVYEVCSFGVKTISQQEARMSKISKVSSHQFSPIIIEEAAKSIHPVDDLADAFHRGR